MSYNGKPCEGKCSKNPPEIRNKLNNYYEYDFNKHCFICKECGHELVDKRKIKKLLNKKDPIDKEILKLHKKNELSIGIVKIKN